MRVSHETIYLSLFIQSRGALRRVQDRLTAAGISTVVGHEIEFLLVGPDGSELPSHLWAQYGLAGVLEFEGFVRDVTNAATAPITDRPRTATAAHINPLPSVSSQSTVRFCSDAKLCSAAHTR